jgi:hypothetical protein
MNAAFVRETLFKKTFIGPPRRGALDPLQKFFIR